MSNSRSRIDLRTWVAMAMLTAVAYVVMYLSKMLPSVNGFLDFDFKDVVICIAGFIYGPLAAALVSIVVALIEMFTISHTGPIGLLMNVLATCSFCCTATLIYKKHRTMKGAIVGLAVGMVLLVVVMLLSVGIKLGMAKVQDEMKRATDAGYWNLYRYDPRLETPFHLDSKEPTLPYEEFLDGEVRYASLKRTFPDNAKELFEEGSRLAAKRYEKLKNHQ